MNTLTDLRAEQIDQGELWQELNVEHHWFHVVRGLVYRGVIAEVGTVAWAVYCAIKAHTGMDTGDAHPSIGRIAEQIGASHDTVQRAMKRLVEARLLNVEKRGRHNIYALTEKIPMTTQDGGLWGHGERKYVPIRFPDFVEELQRLARTGNIPGDRAITINLTVNLQQIQQGDGGTVTMNVGNVQIGGDQPSPSLSELHKRLKKIS